MSCLTFIVLQVSLFVSWVGLVSMIVTFPGDIVTSILVRLVQKPNAPITNSLEDRKLLVNGLE